MGILGKNRTKDQEKRYKEIFGHRLSNNDFTVETQDVKKGKKSKKKGEDERDSEDRDKVSEENE